MNRPIINTETETIIKSISTNKSSGPEVFTGELYQKSREEQTLILLRLFQKIAEEGKLLYSFYEASITLTPKPDKDATKRENYRPISLKNICKNPQQNSSKQNSITLKRSCIMTKWALSQGCKDSSIFANQSKRYTTLTN